METLSLETTGAKLTRVCTQCAEVKDLATGFYKSLEHLDGYHHRCKQCVCECRNKSRRGKKNLPAASHKCKPVDPILEERRERLAVNTAINSLSEKITRLYVEDGSVYVITNPAFPGMVKIGWAADPEKRLGDYTMYAPTPYKLEGYSHAPSIAAEAKAHEYFRQSAVNGEWFQVSVATALLVIKFICLEQSTSGRDSTCTQT